MRSLDGQMIIRGHDAWILVAFQDTLIVKYVESVPQ